jgi:hypothetical protein
VLGADGAIAPAYGFISGIVIGVINVRSTPWLGGNTDCETVTAVTSSARSAQRPDSHGHPPLVTPRQGRTPPRSSKGHPVTAGSPPGSPPLLRSGRGLGDPGDPSCTKVLRKESPFSDTRRRSSDTRGHRHPVRSPRRLATAKRPRRLRAVCDSCGRSSAGVGA